MYNYPPDPNDQTVAGFPTQYPNYQQNQYYQQPPPYQPDPYYQQSPPPYQPGQPDPYRQPPPAKPKVSKKKAFAIGCGSLIGILLLCSLCTAVFGSGNKSTSQTASQSSPTQIMQQGTGQTPTVIITPTATSKPSPTATPTPVPTPTLVPQQSQSTPVPQQLQPTPTPVLVQPTSPPAPTCSGTIINGACYNTNLTGGTLVYSPPASFCSYFICVSSFWTSTNGYVAKCANGKYTHSGGVSGACSKDGGIIAKVYSH